MFFPKNEIFQAKYVKQKRWAALLVMWVGGSELYSPHSPIFHSLWRPLGVSSVAFQSTVCKQLPLWIAKGSLQGGCSSWGLPISRLQFSVASPGASYRELLAKQEALLGTKPRFHVLLAWGCSGLPGCGDSEGEQLSCLLTAPQASWASCSQMWGVPKGWTEKGRQGRAQPQLPVDGVRFWWEEDKARKHTWSRVILSFCAGERFNLRSLQTLLTVPYGKVSYCCLGWREYLLHLH